MLCCGKMICPSCTSLLSKRHIAHYADVERAQAADSPSPGEVQRQIKLLNGSLKCPMCMETSPYNDQEAFQCVQSRAEQHGWDWALLQLGVYYLRGVGVKADPKKAAVWFKKAAAQGKHHLAEHELGEMYRLGMGVKRSHLEAVRWYQKAADGGFTLSQFALGRMLMADRGEGVPKNTTESARLLTLAAEQGYPEAQCVLAHCYERGEGVERSLDKSLFWNKKSVDQGNAIAMANYGRNLISAAGAKYQDNVEVVGHSPIPETMYWARKSVAAGFMDAKIILDKIEKVIGSKCANCQKVAVELQHCSRCKGAMYCGVHCQKLHWKAGHKMDCVDGTGQKKS
jgi:TPR repeat protein